MFGFTDLFASIKRLTTSISTTADIFDNLNADLAGRFHVRGVDDTRKVIANIKDVSETNGNGHVEAEPETVGKGKKGKKKD